MHRQVNELACAGRLSATFARSRATVGNVIKQDGIGRGKPDGVRTRPIKVVRSCFVGAKPADGKMLWLSGRYGAAVYAISTASGRLLHKIAVGGGPLGISVYAKYSLGHTGVFW